MKRILSIIMAVLVFTSLVISGCGASDETDAAVYRIYYADQSKTKLVTENYSASAVDTEPLINELIEKLINGLGNVEYSKPVPESVKLVWNYYDEEQSTVTLSFSDEYYDMTEAEEIICRAALVKTISQVEGIDFVVFMVENELLKDTVGNDISKMSADMFIDSSDTDSLKRMNITLYFTDESGTKLIECDREIVCSTSVSNERLVLSQLIEGPVEAGIYPTVNNELDILSVNVNDGVCYVNFDSDMISGTHNVSNEISIYSIVNTLTELSTVNKVQLLIDGEAYTGLNIEGVKSPLERNLDYVAK